MRGAAERRAKLMLGPTLDGFVLKEHPLRRIRPLVDSVLARMSPQFDELNASGGLPSIPPKHLLKSGLLTTFCAVRSERQFREQLLEVDVARILLNELARDPRRRRLLSTEQFTVDEPLLEGRASH